MSGFSGWLGVGGTTQQGGGGGVGGGPSGVLSLSGGTLTGPLILSGWATDPLSPVPLEQLQAILTNYATTTDLQNGLGALQGDVQALWTQLGLYLPLGGGSLSGPLTAPMLVGTGGVQAGGYGVYYPATQQWWEFQEAGADFNVYLNGAFADNLVRGNAGLVTSVALSGGGPTGAYFSAWDNGGTGFTIWVDYVSDRQYKQNVQPTGVDALALLDQIAVSAFDVVPEVADWFANVGVKPREKRDRKAADRHIRLGLIAQDVEPHVPEAVHPLAHPGKSPLAAETLTLSNEALVPYLLRAVQQLKERLEALEGRH